MTLAAASGDLSQVRSILDLGAPVDGRDRKGKTALMSASKNGHKEVIELLLENGADINSRGMYGQGALNVEPPRAIRKWSSCSWIVEPTLMPQTNTYQTALMCASLKGHTEVVETLLASGADINVKTRKGFTALSLASEQGHEKVVEILFSQKPDLFLCDCQIRRSRYQ